MDLTRPDLSGYGPHRFHLRALHVGAEAVDSVVGDLDRLLHCVVGNDGQHGEFRTNALFRLLVRLFAVVPYPTMRA